MRFTLMVGFIFIFFINNAEVISNKKIYYDANRHVTFLDQKFTQCRETLKELYAQKKDVKSALKILGASLGQCRNFQVLLSHHIKNEKKVQSVRLMKLIAAQDLFESYLIYQILGLEKDKEAKSFAQTLELKLMNILPTFKSEAPVGVKK